jgi:hypothetical protein
MCGVGSSCTTKQLCGGNSTTQGSEIYTKRLQDHKQRYQNAAGIELDTLEKRQKGGKVTILYWIAHLLVAVPYQSCLILPGASSSTRGHDHRFQVPFFRLQCYQQSIFPSIIRLWNNIVTAAAEAFTIDAFKRSQPTVVA